MRSVLFALILAAAPFAHAQDWGETSDPAPMAEGVQSEASSEAPSEAPVIGESACTDGTDSVFRDALSRWGYWYATSDRGDVWVPTAVRSGWRPYLHGRWVYTDQGWLWSSPEPFGWAVYHYGRWMWLADVGWAWLPGCDWAASQVDWSYADDGATVGWEPQLVDPAYAPPDAWTAWTFVDVTNFTQVDVGGYAYAPARAEGSWHNAEPVPPLYVAGVPSVPTAHAQPVACAPPPPAFISHATHQALTPVVVGSFGGAATGIGAGAGFSRPSTPRAYSGAPVSAGTFSRGTPVTGGSLSRSSGGRSSGGSHPVATPGGRPASSSGGGAKPSSGSSSRPASKSK